MARRRNKRRPHQNPCVIGTTHFQPLSHYQDANKETPDGKETRVEKSHQRPEVQTGHGWQAEELFFGRNEKVQVKPKEAHKAVSQLIQSNGWQYLHDIMRQEITEAAFALANAAPMTESEMHFRRGAMWAAVRLIELPDRLLLKLQNEVALSSAKAELGDNDG